MNAADRKDALAGRFDRIAERARRAEDEHRRAKAARRARPGRAPGLSREERRAAADRLERKGKADAYARAGRTFDEAGELRTPGRCEWHDGGRRCSADSSDADHVLGGRWKREMEELPRGEGYEALCRDHHATKHGPDRAGALAQAKEHALRIGSRGLLRHVEDAIARHQAKHARRA